MVLADMKFMAIFSMLFEQGWSSSSSGCSRRAAPPTPSTTRMAWLLVIGLLHAYLIWYGDILVGYAIRGMVLVCSDACRPGPCC